MCTRCVLKRCTKSSHSKHNFRPRSVVAVEGKRKQATHTKNKSPGNCLSGDVLKGSGFGLPGVAVYESQDIGETRQGGKGPTLSRRTWLKRVAGARERIRNIMVCLLTFDRRHSRQFIVQLRISVFTVGQTQQALTNRCVALMPGWLRT